MSQSGCIEWQLCSIVYWSLCCVCIVDVVWGVTQLDNVLYVVCSNSSIIKTYTADTLSPLAEGIHVEGMRDPRDIVVCRHDRQLYVAQWDCIWQVSVDDDSYVNWLNTQFSVPSLSITSRHLLVTSSRPPTVRQYSTTNTELLCVVSLPQYMKHVWHAVETTHGTFVVGHRGTLEKDWKYAVSELLRFYHACRVTSKQTIYG